MCMTILAVDDEPLALSALCRTIGEVVPGCALFPYVDPWTALEAVESGAIQPDTAFLDVEMFELNGLELAKGLKDICPHINIIFVTGHAEYRGEPFHLHTSGYIFKPARVEIIQKELNNLRCPPERKPDGRLQVQCFGNFQVFFQDAPLEFPCEKTKELLAYLVNRRGGACSMGELAAALWAGKPNAHAMQGQLRQLVKDLSQTLIGVGAGDVLVKRWRKLAVLPDAFCCDYYDFIHGETRAVNDYMGEFMAQYSWAELAIANLEGRHESAAPKDIL